MDFKGDFECSRAGWWPAHLTASWLEESFMPTVWKWLHLDRRNSWERIIGKKQAHPDFVLDTWWHRSRARFFSEDRPKGAAELGDLVDALQQHFSLRSNCEFPSTFLRAIDLALLRLLEGAELEYWGNVASKGELEGDSPEEMIQFLRRRIADDSYCPTGSFQLEWRLRAFCEICENSRGHLDSADAEAVANELREICINAEFENERLAHRVAPCAVFPK
jgi:hypothetical protein